MTVKVTSPAWCACACPGVAAPVAEHQVKIHVHVKTFHGNNSLGLFILAPFLCS